MHPTTTRLAPVTLEALPEYAPMTYVDFSQPANRAAFEGALVAVRAQMGREHPIAIGKERLLGGPTFESRNPARPSEVLGKFQSGTRERFVSRLEPRARRRAGCLPRRGGAPHEGEASRVLGAHGVRGRQELGRGGRRHR